MIEKQKGILIIVNNSEQSHLLIHFVILSIYSSGIKGKNLFPSLNINVIDSKSFKGETIVLKIG